MSQRHISQVRCIRCGIICGETAVQCRACKSKGALDVAYDLEDVARTFDRQSLERREAWLWRYRELLPIDELAELPSLQVGMTPIWGAPSLASWAGIGGLWLKDEGRAPTGSLDDRASALVALQARELGKKTVAIVAGPQDGASLACFAASLGLKSILFVPQNPAGQPIAYRLESGAQAELSEAAIFGALIFNVKGSFDDARSLCSEACEQLGWFDYSGPTYLPFEAKKTIGLEIAEQLCERDPDWISISLHDGGAALAAVGRGLEAMRSLGIIKSVPKLLGVESTNSYPFPRVSLSGESASHELPPLSRLALDAIRSSEGALITVDGKAITEAIIECAQKGGVHANAQAGQALAGIKSAVAKEIIGSNQNALALIDGRARIAPNWDYFPDNRPIEIESQGPNIIGIIEEKAKARW